MNTQCDECKEGYTFLNESMPEIVNNCYDICTHYYYFNEHNVYTCTNIEECPSNFNKLIRETKKCINECKNDNYFKFEYNNVCYLQCPEGTIETEPFICTDIPEPVPPTTESPTEAPTTHLETEAPTTELKTEAPTTEIKTEAPTTEIKTEAPTTEIKT